MSLHEFGPGRGRLLLRISALAGTASSRSGGITGSRQRRGSVAAGRGNRNAAVRHGDTPDRQGKSTPGASAPDAPALALDQPGRYTGAGRPPRPHLATPEPPAVKEPSRD